MENSYSLTEFKSLSQEEVAEKLEILRSKFGFHKYQMAELLGIQENAYYQKISQTITRSNFSTMAKTLIWHLWVHGVPEGFVPSVKSKVKHFEPHFKSAI